MTANTISTDPKQHLGIYKCLDDVPPKHRLSNYSSVFEGRDVWREHMDSGYVDYITITDRVKRCERRWKEFADEGGFHHATPTPYAINEWFRQLLQRCNRVTAFRHYYSRLSSFFEWLLHHTEYPHCYNPLIMSAANYETTNLIWQTRLEESDRR